MDASTAVSLFEKGVAAAVATGTADANGYVDFALTGQASGTHDYYVVKDTTGLPYGYSGTVPDVLSVIVA